MNIEQLRKEIKKLNINERLVNIGTEAYCEDCFNLIYRPEDGKWEVFYGEHGLKGNVRVYDTEEEAADEFLKMLRRDIPWCLNHYKFPSLREMIKTILNKFKK